MKRNATHRKSLWFTILALFAVTVAPSLTHAAPPPPPTQLDGRGYFQVSPGIVSVVLHEHGFAQSARWAWPWSLGAGGTLTGSQLFKVTIGGSVEHRILFIEDVSTHDVHALFESRIGAANRRVWGYGIVGVGGTGTFLDFGGVPGAGRDRDAFYGVALQVGSGAQVRVGRRLFFGGELEIDLSYYFPDYARSALNPFQYHTMTIEMTLGWCF